MFFGARTYILLVLFLMVCGGHSQFSYSQVKSGRCGSESGKVDITDKAMCEHVAGNLGLSDTTAQEVSWSSAPPGCSWNSYGDLYYNKDSSSTESCSSFRSCLCLSAPECTRINGNELNTAGCICGTKACSNTGSYCTKSNSTCTLPSCSVTDGLTANNVDCQCGSNECTKITTGLFCDAASSTCSGIERAEDCGSSTSSLESMTNCISINQRCKCTKCKKGYYTNDCSKTCPEPAVAIVTDSIAVFLAVWLTIAYLYFQNAKTDTTEAKDAANDMQDDVTKGQERGSEITEEGSSTAAGKMISQQRDAAHAQARMFTKAFTQKVKALQRIIVARMQVLTAILASISWSPEVPKFLLDILKTLGGFFTFDVPGLLSSPDCLYDRSTVETIGVSNQTLATPTGGMTPIDKWYISLLLPFGLMLLVAIPTCFYRYKHKSNDLRPNGVNQYDKDYERMADGWNNVCTQLSVVWIFATVVTTCLTIVDCDKGTEGKLIMDPSLSCPLGTNIDSAPLPAVLGISMLVLYCFGILGFLYTAIKLAFTSVTDRLQQAYRMKELENKARKRNERKKKREKNSRETKMNDDAKATAFAEQEKDDAEEEQDQREINGEDEKYVVVIPQGINVRDAPDSSGNIIRSLKFKDSVYVSEVAGAWLKVGINQWVLSEKDDEIYLSKSMTEPIEESDTWKSVGWLMEDYR